MASSHGSNEAEVGQAPMLAPSPCLLCTQQHQQLGTRTPTRRHIGTCVARQPELLLALLVARGRQEAFRLVALVASIHLLIPILTVLAVACVCPIPAGHCIWTCKPLHIVCAVCVCVCLRVLTLLQCPRANSTE